MPPPMSRSSSFPLPPNSLHHIHTNTHPQKIRNSGFYSFSVLGIAIILILGTCIVLTGTFIEDLVAAASRLPFLTRSRRLTYARHEWHANSVLHLQRQAHEGVGLGTWVDTDKSVPVTQGGATLAPYDVSDTKHPRLVAERELRDLQDIKTGYNGDDRGVDGEVGGETGYGGPKMERRAQYTRLSSNGPL